MSNRRLGDDELLIVGEGADEVVVVSRVLAALMRFVVLATEAEGTPDSVRKLGAAILDLSEFQSLCSELDGEPGR